MSHKRATKKRPKSDRALSQSKLIFFIIITYTQKSNKRFGITTNRPEILSRHIKSKNNALSINLRRNRPEERGRQSIKSGIEPTERIKPSRAFNRSTAPLNTQIYQGILPFRLSCVLSINLWPASPACRPLARPRATDKPCACRARPCYTVATQ